MPAEINDPKAAVGSLGIEDIGGLIVPKMSDEFIRAKFEFVIHNR